MYFLKYLVNKELSYCVYLLVIKILLYKLCIEVGNKGYLGIKLIKGNFGLVYNMVFYYNYCRFNYLISFIDCII